MSKQLIEDEVGYNPFSIGFPNVGGCMAIVLLTENGLFGFHMTPGNTRKASRFGTFIENKALLGNMLHLYGSCNRANRYAGSNSSFAKHQWMTEMRSVADAIGYHGPITGFDASSKIARIGPQEAFYVEYRRNDNKNCQIFYKRMEKMRISKGFNNPDNPIKKIVPQQPPGTYALANPFNNRVIESATVIPTAQNRGTLNQVVGFLELDSFRH